MSTERLIVLDPFNESHVQLMENYENRSEIENKTSISLRAISSAIKKEEYNKNKKESNEITEDLVLQEDNNIIDCCHIQGEKDIKTCRITFPSTKSLKRKKLISFAVNYALDSLEMEEIFLGIHPEDKNTITFLQTKDYENLGEETGNIIFLTERDEKNNMQRKKS